MCGLRVFTELLCNFYNNNKNWKRLNQLDTKNKRLLECFSRGSKYKPKKSYSDLII